jgi:formylglycine-generating enzyme required for sulfatase activity
VPVDSAAFSGGDSPDGIEHLMGNVREWTATQASYNGKEVVVLQGNWNGLDPVNTVAIVGGGYEDNGVSILKLLTVGDPTTNDEETGFRCVATA